MMSGIKELEKLPPDLLNLVDSYKKYVREQKALKEENQKFTAKPILEVEQEIEDPLMLALQKVDLDCQKNLQLMDHLKSETMKMLASASGNPSTGQYFIDLTKQFDLKMECYNQQIGELQMCLDNINRPPTSADELYQNLRKQHEMLMALSAEIYLLHEKLEHQS